ncbi:MULTISPECIES: universal stress protein [Rhodomicrobium]|uniref:universal stress protein n=1 Tax=Rhodomicrobium TaxID=1068 RepID=UPI000B4A7999|nr:MULTISPECIES: universal stress protein [Rhodomicrobium]
MPNRTIRTIFHEGHRRKFLVVVDESPEAEMALAYAVRRARRTLGGVSMLYVIEPADFQHWLGVEEAYREEAQAKAKAVFRLHARKLKLWGFEDISLDEIIREGTRAEQISNLIHEDPDIGILVLGASVSAEGPGPLVSSLAGGKNAGSFPIPITVVPGGLTLEEIEALA